MNDDQPKPIFHSADEKPSYIEPDSIQPFHHVHRRMCNGPELIATSPYTRMCCSPNATLASGLFPASLKYSPIASGVALIVFELVPQKTASESVLSCNSRSLTAVVCRRPRSSCCGYLFLGAKASGVHGRP